MDLTTVLHLFAESDETPLWAGLTSMCMTLFSGDYSRGAVIPPPDNKQTGMIKSPLFYTFCKTGGKTGRLCSTDPTLKEHAIVHNRLLTLPRGVLMF